MTDSNYSNIWIVNYDGSKSRPITTGNNKFTQPTWSNNGKKFLFKSRNDKATELMGYMWNNDKNPIDADDREDDRYGPGYKAGEKLGDIIEEEIQREFGGYKPW